MERISMRVGQLSGKYRFAEGWRRHLHYGFGPKEFDPVKDLLGLR